MRCTDKTRNPRSAGGPQKPEEVREPWAAAQRGCGPVTPWCPTSACGAEPGAGAGGGVWCTRAPGSQSSPSWALSQSAGTEASSGQG